jgi:hypothetical protein
VAEAAAEEFNFVVSLVTIVALRLALFFLKDSPPLHPRLEV